MEHNCPMHSGIEARLDGIELRLSKLEEIADQNTSLMTGQQVLSAQQTEIIQSIRQQQKEDHEAIELLKQFKWQIIAALIVLSFVGRYVWDLLRLKF